MTNEDYQKIFHEIKNNITFINSSLQLVEKDHPEIKAYPYWNDSMQEVDSLKKMLVELSSARLCNDVNLQKVSLNAFLTELVQSSMASFASEAFHCSTDFDPSLPEIPLDPHRMKRALFNLIKNSFEAMEGRGSICLKARCEGSFVRLDLTDYGGGIAPECLARLFTPFATTKPGGTGLGLLISRQIIEAHGGHLTVDSRPQDGCTFSIFLPCEPAGPQ